MAQHIELGGGEVDVVMGCGVEGVRWNAAGSLVRTKRETGWSQSV